MKVLVLFTAPPDVVRAGRLASEFDLSEAAEEIARLLPGAKLARVCGDVCEILAILGACRPDVVFNLCEAPMGQPDLEPHVAALFEWLRIPFTGCGSETLSLCRRKDGAKAVLNMAGVPVPRTGSLFPCIVKPADEDGSNGIHADSVCEDPAAVERAIARINGSVIVEEFLDGQEFVVSLWGQSNPDHVSIGEVFFQNGLRLFTYAAKWELESADYKNSLLHYDTKIDVKLRNALIATARATWTAVGARGYLRLDLRLNRSGVPCVLDINPNPEVSPEVGMHRAVVEAGWSWERFVHQQAMWAIASAKQGFQSSRSSFDNEAINSWKS